ncbi:glycosyltransferase [Chryseobacterium sp. NKUCC03_KSP]|uniref:glycosyltransferase n=1 Tax=Chryseobacterium sp. NKUCC03_KSP TaxID=2842125 RepID=UPI001C5A657C|nr:glycosyltransferase [Chryseobacterium sp. NKUCC03_KSP]MBW3523438.1 glycosyltransferase [Chryseobacterium sp. NKUCC03_KSP]
MKILHVITRSELGGAQSVVINLANSMCSNHEVIVVAGEDGPMWDALDDRVSKIKIKEIVREVSVIKDCVALFKLKKIYSSIKPDVVHLHSSKIGILGRLAFPPKKIVYSIHGFDSIRINYRKFLPIEKALKNRCKAIVGVSEYDVKNLMNENIKDNVYLIPNGIKDFASIDTNPNSENILAKIKKETGKKIILSISRLTLPKRFDLFCKIAEELSDFDYQFVWIGNKENISPIPQNIMMLGEKNDAHQYYRYADLAILLSDYEGLPISLLEALCYSKPIIASNVGGISEIVLNNQNGFTLDNNEGVFAEKVNYILENEEIYQAFSKKSLEIFHEKLTVEKMVDKYTSLYKL